MEVQGATVNIFGVTFKENCSDLRNSQVFNVVHELSAYGINPNLYDPVADPADVRRECGFDLKDWDSLPTADVLILAVAHRAYLQHGVEALLRKVKPRGIVIDVKSVLEKENIANKGIAIWRL